MFFKRKKECTHSRVSPDKDAQYCPDCGKYVENKWYMTRCGCCNVKRRTVIKFGELVPESKFCHNCGAELYYVQPIATINFIDINFAVLIKEINEELSNSKSQLWVERENIEPIKLLGLNLNFN